MKEKSSSCDKPNTPKDFVKFDIVFCKKFFEMKQECIIVGGIIESNPTNLVTAVNYMK